MKSLLTFLLLSSMSFLQAQENPCDIFSFQLSAFCTPFGGVKLDVPLARQKRPLSCEAAALTSALNYFQHNVTEEQIISVMPFDKTPKSQNTWGNPNLGFVGDIDGKSIISGYGIYWQPVAKLSSRWQKSDWLINVSLSRLISELNQQRPVLVWISALENADIIYWQTPKGEKVRALQDQHVILISGYEGSPDLPLGFYVMDPDEGMRFMNYNDFIAKWDRFERPAVVFNN